MNFKKYFNVNNNKKIAQTIEQTFFFLSKNAKINLSASTNINELSNLGISVCSHLHGDNHQVLVVNRCMQNLQSLICSALSPWPLSRKRSPYCTIPAAKGASVFVVSSKGPSHLLIPSTTN